jgi:hypothetical protein
MKNTCPTAHTSMHAFAPLPNRIAKWARVHEWGGDALRLHHRSASPLRQNTVLSPPLHIPLLPRPCQYSATRRLHTRVVFPTL